MPAELNTAAKLVDVMRFSEEPCLRQVLSVYDACPLGDREVLPFEAFVVKAGVRASELVGGLIMAFRATQAQKSAMQVMASHPEVVQKTIKFAMEEKGFQDRRMLHEATNFIPTKQGTTFNVNLPSNSAPIALEQKRESIDVESEADINDVFPVITPKQVDWQASKRLLLKDKD